MQFSYSRVSTALNCPYQYKLRYIDKLKTLPEQDANNALYLGTAIHEAFETGNVDDAIESYRSNYYILSDLHINEEIKLYYDKPAPKNDLVGNVPAESAQKTSDTEV